VPSRRAVPCGVMSESPKSSERVWALADQFRVLFDEAPIGMLLSTDKGLILRANAAVAELFGYPEDELVGRTVASLTVADDLERTDVRESFVGSSRTSDGLVEKRYMRSDGRIVSARLFLRKLTDEAGGEDLVLGVVIDDTERKEVERRLRYEAFHDRMTGLPNRSLFLDRVGQALIRDAPGAVIVVGLDRMRAINEAFGHSVGDRLVVEVSRRLVAAVTRGDTVARIGGDEFALLATHGYDDTTLEMIGAAGRAMVTQEQRELSTTVSIGVRTLSGLEAPELVLGDALLALQRAKQLGRNRVVVYEPELRGRASRTAEIARQLRDAIGRREIDVDYQPIHRTKDRVLTGFEALVRWRRGALGIVQPTEFVPVAEERGQIQLIGAFVLEHALAELARWRARHPDVAELLTMSVNLSPIQVRDPAHMETLARVIETSGVPPSRVKVEITESVFVDLTREIADSLEGLRRVGVQLVLDDFGTGYSSLNHLQALPFDGLKVDRAFVARALEDPRSKNLVRSIASLARGLSMHTVAEGVENDAQREFLEEAGYDYLQGYLFGRPQTAEAVVALLSGATKKQHTGEM
jgi:diguanylate cyclase (GGDEF)-like protein/PAS domain S-box-containing protein